MIRQVAGIALALALAACAGPGVRERRELPPRANPSAVIAAELAFARAAQDKGQWTAFADYAADDATMFVPGPVRARDWLKGRANPPQAVQWQPHQVWMSCDGTLAVTRGAWQQANGTVGYFTTVWQRQKGGAYKWVLDMGDVLAEPLAAPEFVQAEVAECSSVTEVPATGYLLEPAAMDEGASIDGSLTYEWAVLPDGTRDFRAYSWNGREMREVVSTSVSNTDE